MIDTAKAAIIVASFIAGILGFVLLSMKKPIPAAEE
jgi:Na+/H+ antiporter NhaA